MYAQDPNHCFWAKVVCSWVCGLIVLNPNFGQKYNIFGKMIHNEDEVRQKDSVIGEGMRYSNKRVSMQMNLQNFLKVKPKFNSFLVQKSQFLQSGFDSYDMRQHFQGKQKPTVISSDQFQSYRSHLTINSSSNIFSKQDIQNIFTELADGGEYIKPEVLKQCLFEINEPEEEATNMISLIDTSGIGVVDYKDFEKFFIGKMQSPPNSEQSESLPENLKIKAFHVNFIEKNSEILNDLRDPQIAEFVANQFKSLLRKY